MFSVSEVASTSALTLPLDSSSPIGSLWKKGDNVQSPDTDSPTGAGDDHSIENSKSIRLDSVLSKQVSYPL